MFFGAIKARACLVLIPCVAAVKIMSSLFLLANLFNLTGSTWVLSLKSDLLARRISLMRRGWPGSSSSTVEPCLKVRSWWSNLGKFLKVYLRDRSKTRKALSKGPIDLSRASLFSSAVTSSKTSYWVFDTWAEAKNWLMRDDLPTLASPRTTTLILIIYIYLFDYRKR